MNPEEKARFFLNEINETTEQSDTTLANGIKTLIAGYGKGGGGSIVDITPVLSSDSDRVITNAPTFYNNKYKWFVFNSDIDDYAYPDEVPRPTLVYIGYDFEEKKNIIAVKVRYIAESNTIQNLKVIGSDDGITWNDISDIEYIGGGSSNFWHTFLFNDVKSYKMYAVQFGEYKEYAKLGSIKFYELQ